MASKKKPHKKRKLVHATKTKKKFSKKPAPKKSLGGTLQKRASNKKTSAKPRTTKRTKSVTRKSSTRSSNVRYARKSFRTNKKYTTRTRVLKIKKRTEKFKPALKPTPKNVNKLAKKARAYTKKSKKSVYIKMKVTDKQSKKQKWVSIPRNKITSDELMRDLFELLAEYAMSEQYGLNNPMISQLEIEQNL